MAKKITLTAIEAYVLADTAGQMRDYLYENYESIYGKAVADKFQSAWNSAIEKLIPIYINNKEIEKIINRS